MTEEHSNDIPVYQKFICSVALVVFAVILAIVFPAKDRFLCLVAMILSSLGDIVLMNFKKIGDRLPIPNFYAGAFFFMAGHVVYTCAFLSLIRDNGYDYINPGFWTAFGILVLSGILFSFFTFLRGTINRLLYALAIAYLLLIGVNCATVFSYSYSAGGIKWVAAVGVLSFVISDMIIGLDQLLGITSSRLQKAIWIFYPMGQFLIIWHG